MSDHVSLARPADELTSAWTTRFHWFDAYFAVVGVGVSVFVLQTADTAARGWGAVGLLGGIAVLYTLVGRRIMRDEAIGWTGVVYLGGTFVLYATAVALVNSSSFALFAICPQCFMTLPAKPGVVAVTAFTGVHVVVLWFSDRDWGLIAEVLPSAVMIVVLTSIFGIWSQRILVQSDERAALVRELAASRAEVSRLGMLAERQRIAGDIHDTIAQGLSSVVMLIQAARAEPDPARADAHLALALDTARDNLGEARALVGALTPALLDGRSLVDAIRRLAPSTAVRGSVRPLSTGVDVVLLRAAQEALTNVGKHALGPASVSLEYGPAAVTLTVCDPGPGFDPAAVSPAGYGLSGMLARVSQVGGSLTVDSAPGGATTVRVEVPA
ncbi:two-component sensor histidine kinase [Asanoa ishikariensis]|uniref:Signal transduction histidine kinase n=1 Tax=Asanoa ishikariensis TaxID=137265 RepID=A0A1H3U0Q9_9ACTN|nr:sensor histidine kinase [Asanoa ishikariensis]GIF67682.1 two-component sensor histidine kinase [Asanoa ishikariensis]SDZ55079.1 Signal transduction histidine kinase [Asanoa ishikariensis]